MACHGLLIRYDGEVPPHGWEITTGLTCGSDTKQPVCEGLDAVRCSTRSRSSTRIRNAPKGS